MKLKLFFLSLISLFTVAAVQANEAFRSLLVDGGIYYWGLYSFGWRFLLLVFTIKCFCIRQFLKETTGKTVLTILITVAANFLSIILGFVGGLLIAAGYSHLVYSRLNWTYTAFGESLAVFSIGAIPGPYVIYGVVVFVGSVVINVIAEGLVISPYVAKTARKNMFFWLFIVNALSVGMVLGGLGAQWYRVGKAPWKKYEKMETTRRVRSRRVR